MYKPEVQNWHFVSMQGGSPKYDEEVMEMIRNFVRSDDDNIDLKKYFCCLRGFVVGSEKFDDDDMIDTSFVREVERCDAEYLVAKTKTGSRYYIKIEEMSY